MACDLVCAVEVHCGHSGEVLDKRRWGAALTPKRGCSQRHQGSGIGGGGCVPAHPGECFSAMGGEGDVSFVRGAAAYMPGPGLSKSHEKGPPGQRGDPA